MKRLRRWLNRVAANSPQVQTVLRRACRAIEAAETIRQASKVEDLMSEEIAVQYANLKRRMADMMELRLAETACFAPEAAQRVREAGPPETPAQFKERLWELELALEDRGWVREVTLSNLEFSRIGIQQLIRICRIYALKNPIVKRAAIICRLYVFGRGVEIRSDDDAANQVIQGFIERNKAEIGHTGLASKEQDMQTDGSLYLGLQTAPNGEVSVMQIDPLEIMDLATSPDDPSRAWYFYRMWTRSNLDPSSGINVAEPMKCYYPSLELVMGLDDGSIPSKYKYQSIAGVQVNWDMPIQRSRDAETPSKWRWSVPPLYALLDWARAYKDFLEDWATIQRALSRFSMTVETKGGQAAIAAYQALLSTTFANNDGTQIESNPPPVTGSAHIGGPGTKIEPFKTAGVQNSPEQARRLLLMGAAASGMPETFFGDASTGSLATAVSLDRPTELKFTEIQRRWMYDLDCMLRYVLMVSKTSPTGKMREARRGNPAPQLASISIKFPNVVEHDIANMVQAICWIATCGGRTGISAGIVDRRTVADLLLAEIGYDDRDKLLEQIYGKNYNPADDVTDQRSQVPPQSLKQATGKAVTDLSLPPPLPEPAPPPVSAALPPKPAALPAPKAVKPPKESLLAVADGLRKLRDTIEARNGR